MELSGKRWVVSDMDIFDIAVAKKLAGDGGGGGGGGSSDFSTAEVTFTNNVGARFLISTAVDDEDDVASFPMIEGVHGIAQAILYKGTAFGLILDEGVNVTTTGAVEYDDGFLIITGDCAITIS